MSWRSIEGPRGPVGLQMAFDALLLAGPAGDLRQPCLRFYRFDPAGLSLGWFQTLADVPPAAQAGDVARRLSGGGAIHHAAELTFAIAAPLAHPLYTGPVARSYERVHAAIARALAALGVEAELRRARALACDRAGSGMCFEASSPLDLVWQRPTDGRWAKGVGSAQRRRAGRVLHHGSIKLAPEPLEPAAATLLAEAEPDALERLRAELAAHLARELGALLGGVAEPRPATADELERAMGAADAFSDRAALAARPRRARSQSPR